MDQGLRVEACREEHSWDLAASNILWWVATIECDSNGQPLVSIPIPVSSSRDLRGRWSSQLYKCYWCQQSYESWQQWPLLHTKCCATGRCAVLSVWFLANPNGSGFPTCRVRVVRFHKSSSRLLPLYLPSSPRQLFITVGSAVPQAPERMPEDMPKDIITEDMPKDMPDECQRIFQIECQKECRTEHQKICQNVSKEC